MEPKEGTFQTVRRARYHQLGSLNQDTCHLWFVLHGYGQLSEYFIQHFSQIAGADSVVIAPEALSRFYLGDEEWKRVGASWMTKEDRLNEIDDQIDYLDGLLSHISDSLDMENVTLTLLGFSQGTATAWRWISKGKIRPDNFIIWAGTVPPEDLQRMETILNGANLWVTVGTRDKYISEEAARKKLEQLKQLKPDVRTIIFEDTHRIHAPTLAQIVSEIRGQ